MKISTNLFPFQVTNPSIIENYLQNTIMALITPFALQHREHTRDWPLSEPLSQKISPSTLNFLNDEDEDKHKPR